MSWRITIPGQPPTINHAYEPQTRYRKASDGRNIPYTGIGKNASATAYQSAAALITGVARPSGWTWQGGYIRLVYRFYLSRDADCDNLLKILNDAIARKIDVNDRWFLPMVMSKRIVKEHETRVEIVVIQDGDPEWIALEAFAARPDDLT